jgi:hypothetical protein
VTTETVERDVHLPWDSFLNKELERMSQQFAENLRRHTETFREMEWPQIKLQLQQIVHRDTPDGPLTYWNVPDGMEPHWMGPGRAVFWQEHIVRERRVRDDENGKPERYLEEVNYGWRPTSAILVNNASIFASVLQRGLRMRPPEIGVDAEALRSATPPEGLIEEIEQPAAPRYTCYGGPGNHADTIYQPSWKAYIRHCSYRRCVPDMTQCPDTILKRARGFQWYCFVHNQGYNNSKLAQRHIKDELRKPGRSVHPTFQQMEVNQ